MPLLFLTVALIVSVVIYFVSTQRELVGLDEKVKNAISQIGVQIETRWDAISALTKLTGKYSMHEYNTLQNTIQLRRSAAIETGEDALQQINALDQVMSRINAVAEEYPDLKASDIYTDTIELLNEFENNVRYSRQMYNDTATQLNKLVRQWPSSFIARLLGFSQVKYLQLGNAKSEYPNI